MRPSRTFRHAIQLKPNHAETYNDLGNALWERGQPDDSIAAFRQAIRLKPDYAEAHNNLGSALKGIGQLAESIASHQQAIRLKPDFVKAHVNLGIALRNAGRFDEAVNCYQQALRLKSNNSVAYSNLANALKEMGQLDEAIAAYRQAMLLKPDLASAHSNLVYTLHFHPGYSAEMIHEEHQRWNRQHAEPLKRFIQVPANDSNPNRRLRIGYVSPDLREHPVGRFLLPLLANHDKSDFEIFAYAQVLSPDATTQRLRSYVDGWRNIVGLSDAQAADLIRQGKSISWST